MQRQDSRHGPVVLDRADALPLWRQLYDDLLGRVARGEFPDRFPGEIELTESYGVSRHTVREALRRLRRDGLVESSRGRTSVANPDVISHHLGAMYSLSHQLESRGVEGRSELLAADLREDESAATQLGLPPSTALPYVERLLYADDEPIAWDRTWLHPASSARVLHADLARTAAHDELRAATGSGSSSGRETIRAVMPSPQVRGRLAMDEHEAALEVERLGYVEERAVEVRTTVIRGSRFCFTAEWSANRAYQVEVTARRRPPASG
jgi:GntR family transcriptional regulator